MIRYNEINAPYNEMANVQRHYQEKNMELDRVDQLKNRFLGRAAHDLLKTAQRYSGADAHLLDRRGRRKTRGRAPVVSEPYYYLLRLYAEADKEPVGLFQNRIGRNGYQDKVSPYYRLVKRGD
ncbi:MAG: hypothetical protein U5L09_13875 [Bacteroidales bacterium]|nr:hypothetical protein [Bacteroidales bacterium]